jgi:hypothetical protein
VPHDSHVDNCQHIKTAHKNIKQSHNTSWRRRGDSFMTSALDGLSGQRQAPAAFYPRGKDPVTHWTGGWVGPRAGLDTEAIGKKSSCLCRGSNLDLPFVQSVARLYWLSYPGSIKKTAFQNVLLSITVPACLVYLNQFNTATVTGWYRTQRPMQWDHFVIYCA